jgi:hypothetical protein
VTVTRTGRVYAGPAISVGNSPMKGPGGGSMVIGYVYASGKRAPHRVDDFVGGLGIQGRAGPVGGGVSPGTDLVALEIGASSDIVSIGTGYSWPVHDFGEDLWN